MITISSLSKVLELCVGAKGSHKLKVRPAWALVALTLCCYISFDAKFCVVSEFENEKKFRPRISDKVNFEHFAWADSKNSWAEIFS